MVVGRVSVLFCLGLLCASSPGATSTTTTSSVVDTYTGSASSGLVSDGGSSGTTSSPTIDDDGPTGTVSSGTVSDEGPPETTTSLTDNGDDRAECDSEGYSADYQESFSGEGSTLARYAGSTTGCPNHVNWPLNGYAAKEFKSNATIPAYPMLFDGDGTTDLSSTEGQVAILLNGVAQFSSYAHDTDDTAEPSGFMEDYESADLCGGLATDEGWYHHHSTPGCLQEQAMAEAGTLENEHSPQIGWSYDGFPLYGQLGPGGVEMLVCGETGADEDYCLDSCMGYEGELPDVDSFLYRYYTSCGTDEAFAPHTIDCYRGCCPEGMTCNSPVEDCESSATEGYSSSYVPAKAANLSEHYDADLIEGDDADYINSTSSLDCSLYLGTGTVTASASGAPALSSLSPYSLAVSAAGLLAASAAFVRGGGF